MEEQVKEENKTSNLLTNQKQGIWKSPCNYCEHRTFDFEKIKQPIQHRLWKSEDAEIAIWDSQGTWYNFGYDTVKGCCSPNEVAEWVTRVSQFPEGHCFPTTSEQSEEEENQ